LSLGAVDLGVLTLYLVGVVLVGLWMGRKASSAADYMLGDRHVAWPVILVSIIATETSTVTFLSIPGFAFDRDMTWIQIPIGFVIGRFLASALLLPLYFKGELFTSYEVLARRFGGASQRLASAMFIVTRCLADGLRLFLTAIVVQELTGLDLGWAVVLAGGTTILYTYFGGMRAVLWTDCVQFMVYVGGALIAFWVLLARLPGGWSDLVTVGGAAGKLRWLDTSLDWTEPYTLWAGLFGGIFVALSSHGVDQLMVQRYLCARNLREAQRALNWSGVLVAAQFALFLLIGVGLYAFYQQHPPAVPFDRPDRVFARFILDELPVGVVGILLGAIFAAAMSTLSSSLNSCATAATRDLYKPLRPGATSDDELRMTKLLTAVFGVVQIAVGIVGQQLESSVVGAILGIAAFTTGLVLGVFFLGLFCRRAGQQAALAGLAFGLVAMAAIYFATPLAWPWYALVGSALTYAAGWFASHLWPAHLPQTS
jgi:SSS family solute:Na+ symporter